ncbi:uncharacterized protein LOC116136405 [Pistacia vera]|uniref:uncharacterized protein LOC116136405 n=1 Tax=Pistacia vera TaxID=55513 RepID=UPI001262FC7F|nr:uncharacterized protein LOC116136405 [Pistacia vera]
MDDFGQYMHDAELIGVPFTGLRQVRNRIHGLTDGNGTHITDSQGLGRSAVGFFKDLLAASTQPQIAEASRYFFGRISPDMISPLTTLITDDEIRFALFSIPDDKAPSPDGYTSLFFKRAWDIISRDFRATVRHFFATNEMPRCVNATKIALVPKNYHPGDTSPRCAFKVDIRKAFDIVSWDFILLGLHTVGFLERMVRWIMTCISTQYFSIALNRELHDFFRSSEGVREGDPLSPYQFVLAMEGLADASSVSLIKSALDYFAKVSGRSLPGRSLHGLLSLGSLCSSGLACIFDRKVTSATFFLDVSSVSLIKSALDYFAKVSGLVTNAEKNQLFLSGVTDEKQIGLQSIASIRANSVMD